jgi:S-adenosylmethionine:tRNA ribosyltransferase-isomerase
VKPGDALRFADDLAAEVTEKSPEGDVALRFSCEGAALRARLERHGRMPLPPYIHRGRAGEARDRDDYQTMFAAKDGAVAAPTAGLHFTPALLAALKDAGLALETVTLHVGAGTFLPVKAEDTADHRMHSEYGMIDAATAARLNAARARGGRIVAIGTTSLRLLESAADESGLIKPFAAATALFITPGYRFRAIDVLLTNFHLPRSTLFMLVGAFAGLERMKAAYAHAVAARYRFFSYGDACLLFPPGAR